LKIQARLESLVATAKDDSPKLQQLYDQLEHLRQGVALESFSPAAAAQLQSLLGMPEHAFEQIIQRRILKSLAFEGMYGRYETVDDAHYKTLRWVFDDDTNYEEDEEEYEDEEDADAEDESEDEDDDEDVSNTGTEEADKDQINYKAEEEAKTIARESLLTWMSSGAGVFHVSGKLGSGKSTLMKYLCDHASTKQLLEKWAGKISGLQLRFHLNLNGSRANNRDKGTRQLVFASFFFWKPGSTMQKTLPGLIRSLLHDLLKACPELTRDIFPDYWERIKSAPWQIRSNLSISDKDIRRAFSRIISDPSLYTNHCFCFFIDGLDEYEGTHQEDPKTMVDMLTNWTKNAPTTVKICVSSREHNLFMNSFSENQRIRLHILTKSDMTSYVVDKLRHIDREEDQRILAESIVENAEGIFVWVTLVVKRIREQIENGASLETLQRELDALPKELDSLFDHILNSLADSDLKAAYQTCSMVIELNKYRLSLPLLSYSFLDDFTRDHEFALRKDVYSQPLTPTARAVRIESARKRLNACCRGLLETRKDESGEPASEIIMITHRSISEFLLSRGRRCRMEPYLEGFNTVDAISQLTLAELWSRDAGDIFQGSCLDALALSLVSLRTEAKLDTPPYSFLDCLALAWHRHRDEGNFDRVGKNLAVFLGFFEMIDFTILDKSSPPGVVNQESLTSLDMQRLRDPIFAAAACGNYEYVLWKLERDPSSIPLFTPLRLMYCILRNNYDLGPEVEQQLLNVISTLHTHHGLCPSTVSKLFGTFLYPATEGKTESYGFGDEATEVTLWHHILLFLFVYVSFRQHLSFPLSSDCHGCIIEKFLEYGADPHFYISVPKPPKFQMKLVTRVQGERREQWFVSPHWPSIQAFDCENRSLEDLVEAWNFKNKLRILELIKINTLKIESAIAEENMMLLKELTPFTPGMEEPEDLEDAKELPLESNSEGTVSAIDSGSNNRGLAGIFAFWSLKLGFSAGISIAILILGQCKILARKIFCTHADYA
jgi:hypothetical protein